MPPFPGQWDRLKLDDKALRALEVCLMSAPLMGSVVKGAGGLRKARFAIGDQPKGRSGGYRVFYVHFPEYGHVILWAIIDKHQDDNLPAAQRKGIAQQIARLKQNLDKGFIL